MIVAIDYDDTFTADPTAWRNVIAALRANGHVVICVTARQGDQEDRSEIASAFSDETPIVFAGNAKKRLAAEQAGYKVNVWIDDTPSRIDSAFIPMKRRAVANHGR